MKDKNRREYYLYRSQLLPSSGNKLLVTNNTISTIHQIPTPPRVRSFPTAVPV